MSSRLNSRSGRHARKRKSRKILTVMLTLIILLGAAAAAIYLYPLVLPKVDPFEYAKPVFEGATGEGTAVMDISSDVVGTDTTKITYEISKTRDLSQGETVLVTASSRSYNLIQKEKEYVVSGLDEPLTNAKLLGEDSIRVLNENAEALMKLNMGDPENAFSVTNTLLDYEPTRIWLMTNPDSTNILYHVTRAKFQSYNGDEKSVYLVSYFTDVYYNASEDGKISFESCNYIGDDVLLGEDVVYDSYITGYPTLKKAKNDLVNEQRSGKVVTSIKLNG